MGTLSRRIELLERQRRQSAVICPGHIKPLSTLDYRDGLRAFSPIAEERAAYEREQDELEATPACERCGWRPEPIRITVATDWGWSSDDGPDVGGAA